MSATVTPIRKEFQVHRFNPVKNGVLSLHIVLPWEDREEYEEILRGLLTEHQPKGPTAYHLVEDLACVLWRKRRLLQAEHARLLDGFHDATTGFSSRDLAGRALTYDRKNLHCKLRQAVTKGNPEPETLHQIKDQMFAWLDDLERNGSKAYKRILAKLGDRMRAEWEDCSTPYDGDEPAHSPDAEGLTHYLNSVLEGIAQDLHDSEVAPQVANHAQGAALNLNTLQLINKVEAHLDQKMQRLLATLRDLKAKT